VGEDREGHPVIVDRVGQCPPMKLIANFDEDSFIRQQVYNRECLRLYTALNSEKRQRRVYKARRRRRAATPHAPAAATR